MTPPTPSAPSTRDFDLVARVSHANRGPYRSPRWTIPTPGTRLRIGGDTLLGRCTALSLVAPPDAIFIGATAAALHDLPTPAGWRPRRLEIATRSEGYHLDRAGVRGRRRDIDVRHITTVGGLRVTTPARTFVDLGTDWYLPDLVALGDAALRAGTADEASIIRVLAACTGQRGVRKARRALALLNAAARSPQESRLRVILIEAGLPHPEVNGVILDEAGEFLAIGDLVYREQRVIVEYDGEHHLTREQQAKDAARRNLLALRGWLVITIVSRDLAVPGRAAAKVGEALNLRRAA